MARTTDDENSMVRNCMWLPSGGSVRSAGHRCAVARQDDTFRVIDGPDRLNVLLSVFVMSWQRLFRNCRDSCIVYFIWNIEKVDVVWLLKSMKNEFVFFNRWRWVSPGTSISHELRTVLQNFLLYWFQFWGSVCVHCISVHCLPIMSWSYFLVWNWLKSHLCIVLINYYYDYLCCIV
jgi:hypothetical protein